MVSSAGAGWRIAAAGAALAGYALLSHLLMVHAAHRPWAVAVLFGPLVLWLAAVGWQRRQGLLLAACAGGVALLVVVVARGGIDDINRMYLLQYTGIQAALAWAFGSTLREGGAPFITTLAREVHTRLHLGFTPALAAYTRSLTAFWAGYFVVMLGLSLALYVLAPWAWWSLFANVATPLSVLVLMLGEHALRYRWHPEFERVGLQAAIDAYRRSGAAQEGSPP